MTRKELENIKNLDEEIAKLKHQLEREQRKSIISSPISHIGFGSVASDPTARAAINIADLEAQISDMRDRREKSVQFIRSIPDKLTYEIVYSRCVLHMSWRRVAFKVSGGNTEENVRQIYSRFMKKLH